MKRETRKGREKQQRVAHYDRAVEFEANALEIVVRDHIANDIPQIRNEQERRQLTVIADRLLARVRRLRQWRQNVLGPLAMAERADGGFEGREAMADPTITGAEIKAVLEAVERGELTATRPDPGYCGDEEVVISNGWRLMVFNDCDSFDYIETVEAPDGRSVDLHAYTAAPRYKAALAMPMPDEDDEAAWEAAQAARQAALDAIEEADGLHEVRWWRPDNDSVWGWVRE